MSSPTKTPRATKATKAPGAPGSPITSEAVSKLSELTPADTKLILLGSVCLDGSCKIDYKKLALLAGVQNHSAASNYNRAKRRLAPIIGEEITANTAEAKHSLQDETPTKPRATKRRKATPKSAIKKDVEAEDAEIVECEEIPEVDIVAVKGEPTD